MNSRFIYTGGSWAHSSYDRPNTEQHDTPTNLAKEWNIPCVDLSKPGGLVSDRVDALINSELRLPIVWVYNEPLGNLVDATGIQMDEFIQQPNWLEIWQQCNYWCLEKINSLGLPVFLIGASSDIVDCQFSNITVGCPSWQKYLAESAGIKVDNNTVYVKMEDGGDYSFDTCWGAEFAHKFMHEHPDVKPSPEIINAIWDIFFFWKELEKADLFFEVHPNKKANQQFAAFLKPQIHKFLQDTQ